MRFYGLGKGVLAAVCAAGLGAAAWGAPARPAITGVAHIGLAAQNMDADRTFYTHMLGWNVVPSVEFTDGLSFYGNPLQTVEIRPATSPSEPTFDHVAFATANANALRLYLQSKGVAVPDSVITLKGGEQRFRVKDPEGNVVEFVQRPAQVHFAKAPDSISGRIIHVGILVHSADAEDRFYKDILGFRPYWHGGMKDGVTDWSSLQVPDGTDWIEYMLNAPPDPSRHQLGVDDHFSLGVADMDAVVADLEQRGWTPSDPSKKQMGKDGKVQLNLYAPDDTRVEYMEFKPRQAPCCSPFTGPEPQPAAQ